MSSKVSLFVPSLRGGGAERVMVNLAQGFANKGYDVDLVLVSAEGPYLKQIPSNVEIVNLHSSRVIKSLPALIRYLRRTNPKVLLSALNHANIVAIVATKLANVNTKIIASEHSTLSQSLRHVKLRRSKAIPRLMKWFYPMADHIIAVSRGVAEDLIHELKLPADKIKVIYNPVMIKQLIVKAEKDVTHPWFKKNQPPAILSVGRLTDAKDYPTLIQSFALVRKKIQARLVILGEGDKRQELIQLIHELGLNDDVSMPGYVDNPYAYMKRAAVFVLSSKWEGFGNVLVEAMACGCPVVSTDCPSGPREILEGGKYGLLVPVGDVEQLAVAIKKTLNSGISREMLKDRAKNFEVGLVSDLYLEAFGIGCE